MTVDPRLLLVRERERARGVGWGVRLSPVNKVVTL